MFEFKKTNLRYLILIVVSIFFCCFQSSIVSAETVHRFHHKHFRKVAYRTRHHHLYHAAAYHAQNIPAPVAKPVDDVQFTIQPDNTVVARDVAIPEDAASMTQPSETPTAVASASDMPSSVSSAIDVVTMPEEHSSAVEIKQEELSTQAVKPNPLDLADALGIAKSEDSSEAEVKSTSVKTIKPGDLSTPAVRSKPIDLAVLLNASSEQANTQSSTQASTQASIVPVSGQVASRESAAESPAPSLPERLLASLRQLSKKPVDNTLSPAPVRQAAPVPQQTVIAANPVPVAAPPQNPAPSLPSRLLASLKPVAKTPVAPVRTVHAAVPPPVKQQQQQQIILGSLQTSTGTQHASDTSAGAPAAQSLPARLFASLRQLSRKTPPAETTVNPVLAAAAGTEPAYIHKQSVFGGFAASMHRHLVDFIQKTVTTLRYSNYKLGGSKFDTTRGVYITDCSGFVDNILRKTSPHAYSSLVNATGALTPATQHYYTFFQELADNSDNYWNKVDDVGQLRAGDILVFRYKNSRGIQTGGHVMVVMDKPIRDTNMYFVRVADSAPTRHSEDTRPIHEGGIGIGTLVLKASKSGRPAAYAWGIGGLWNHNVNFAMARPIDFD